MEHSDLADFAERCGDAEKSQELRASAFRLEEQAAQSVAENFKLEPTRSVLHRSAAWLAIGCGKHREAVQLANRGLAGQPPAGIADELREALREAEARLAPVDRQLKPPTLAERIEPDGQAPTAGDGHAYRNL